MIRRLLFVLAVVLLPSSSAVAQTAGALARVGFGARGLAIGNALIGDVSGLASPWYNPALAPFIKSQNLNLSAALLSQDRRLQFVELGTPLRPRAGIAAGLIHAGVRNIDLRDHSGYHTGMASTDEYAFFVAFGVQVSSRVSLGVGLQLFRNSLHEDLRATQTLGLDVGLSMRLWPGVHIGIVADDLLARYSWDTSALYSGGGTTSDPFPSRFRIGASWTTAQAKLRLLAEYESRFSRREVLEPDIIVSGLTPRTTYKARRVMLHASGLRVGAEYQLVPILFVRAGLGRLENIAQGGPQPSAGFLVEQSLGLLLTHAAYTVVLEPWALGAMHLITVRFFL